MAKKTPKRTTMASEGRHRGSKGKRTPFSPNKSKSKTKKTKKTKNHQKHPLKDVKQNENPQKNQNKKQKQNPEIPQIVSAEQQKEFFLGLFESANSIKLSSLELQSFQDACFLKLSSSISQDASNLGKHVKDAFGSSWKQVLCEDQLVGGEIDPGNPAVLVVCASAIRSLELLRGLRSLTTECQAVKLFSKHLKIDDQVAQLKNRVNIASGTPSRIKKLCEMEALGLSRLTVLVLDMHSDVKGYSLFTLPQVRDEFWDLYKTYFHSQLVQGNLRVCLYGPISTGSYSFMKKSGDE